MFGIKRGRRDRDRAAPRQWHEAQGGAFLVDRSGNVLGFDERMERLTGWPAVEIVGRHKDRNRAGAGSLYDGSIPVPDEARNVELKLRCKDGSVLDVEVAIERLPGRGGRIAARVLRILTLSGDSTYAGSFDARDGLTGLQDRESFSRHLNAAFDAASRQGRPLALILANVDRLRRINDVMGREAGDEVLARLAGILRASSDRDGGIARVGDDDFAILLPDAGRGEARQTAARLRHTVERFRFFGPSASDQAPPVTLSLGAASYPADAESGADLMRRAQEALDEARMLGRNRVWCYTRRPRVPVEVPVYFDSSEPSLAGFTHDLSPSGVFVHTAVPVDTGMRCALAFPLPHQRGKVHVVGRVVRTVPEAAAPRPDGQVPGMGIEFERYGREDRRAIESFLHASQTSPLTDPVAAVSA